MELRKNLSSPPEPEEIRQMVRYAKNVIEEFRRAKHYKNILSSPFLSSRTLSPSHVLVRISPTVSLSEVQRSEYLNKFVSVSSVTTVTCPGPFTPRTIPSNTHLSNINDNVQTANCNDNMHNYMVQTLVHSQGQT